MPKAPPYRQGIVKPRPAPKKGGAAKAPIFPNFDKPPVSALSKPKAKPKPQPQVQRGPYTKGYSPAPPKAKSRPKPTAAQTQAAFERSSLKDPAVITQRANALNSGEATQGKGNVIHYRPYNIREQVGSDEANSLSLGGLLDRVSRDFVGPNITDVVEGKSPGSGWMVPVEAAGILPFGKIGRVVDVAAHIISGVHQGEDAARVIEGARQVARTGRLHPDRVVNLGGYHATVTSPPTVTGRAVARVFDKNTEAQIAKRAAERGIHPQQALQELSQSRNPVERAAAQHAQNLMNKSKMYDTPGLSLTKLVADANLKPDEAMAIKSVAKGVHPDVTIAQNEKRITALEDKITRDTAKLGSAADDAAKAKLEKSISDNKGFVHNLKNDNIVLQASKKHLDLVPAAKAGPRFTLEGVTHAGERPVLKPGVDKASKALNAHWDNFFEVSKRAQAAEIGQWQKRVQELVASGKSEKDAQRIASKDFLSPEQAARRIHQPGRLDLGATWRPGEDILPKELRAQRDRVNSLQRAVNKSEATDRAKVARGSLPNQPIVKGSTRTLNLRRALNVAEDKLASMEAAHATRTGTHPSALYGVKQGIAGHEDFTGGLAYYPSVKDIKKFSPKTGTYASGAETLPYEVKKQPIHEFTGHLQETGQESVDPMSSLGRQAIARQGRVWGNQMLQDLRVVSLKGTLPVNAKGEVDKTMTALRLTATIPRDVMDKANAVMSGLVESGAKDLTEQQLREASIEFNQILDEYLMPKASQWQNEEGHLGFIAKPLAAAIKDTRRMPPEELRGLITAYHNTSQVVRDMMIYTKVGHTPPRAASNVIMATLGGAGAKDFVKGLMLTHKLYKNNPEILRWQLEEMGSGYFKAYSDAGVVSKAVGAVSRAVVKPIEFSADRWARYGAYNAYAIKEFGDLPYGQFVKKFKDLMRAQIGTEDAAAARRIKQLSREASGEYDGLGPVQKSLSSFIFLYRWIRTSTKWTGRFVINHPIKAAAVGGLTYQYGYKAANPIYNRFNILGHNVQTAMPWSTPVEETERIGTSLLSGKPPPLGSSLGSVINPAILTVLGMAFHRDLETGTAFKGNAIIGGLEQLFRQTPPGALLQGKASLTDRILKFLGGNWAPTTKSPNSSVSPGPGSGPFKFTKAQEAALRKAASVRFTPAQQKALDNALKRLK